MRRFIFPYLDTYFAYNPIIGFIDNNKEKVGTYFEGIMIYDSDSLATLEYDEIVIASITYFEEISSGIIQKGINPDCIKSTDDITDDIVAFFSEKYRFGSNVFVISSNDKYLIMKHEFDMRFHVIGVADFAHMEEIKTYDWDYILLMYGQDTSKEESLLSRQIINTLWEQYAIDKERIITYPIYYRLAQIDLPIRKFGCKYPDKQFLVIHASGMSGLGSLVCNVAKNVIYAKEKGYIPVVDLYSYPNNYLEPNEVGKVNAWEKFFAQPGGYSMQDIKEAKNVIWSGVGRSKIDIKNLDFLQVNEKLREETEEYCKGLFKKEKKYLGVLFRGTDYTNLKPLGHQIQPSIEQMIETVKKKKEEWDIDEIYLCTEVDEAIGVFKKEFGECLHFYPQKRYKSNCNAYLSSIRFDRENDAYIRGSDYWILLNALSRCHCLVAGNCTGTAIACLLNKGNYEHTYIFQLGLYGWN